MKLLHTILLSMMSMLMVSCYQDIDMRKYQSDPTPVLNCVVSADTTILASVSRTVFFTDYREDDPIISDASVKLTVNGNYVGTMEYDSQSRRYLSNYTPKAGDKILVEASTSLGDVSGECEVPRLVAITDVKLSGRIYDDKNLYWGGGRYGKKYEVTYSITFTDDAAVNDYYCIRIENAEAHQGAEHLDYSHDEVFRRQQSDIDASQTEIEGKEGRTFSDELFNGKTYTMKIVQTNNYYGSESPLNYRIILYSLSEGYYKYLTGILNTDEDSMSGSMANSGMAEPTAHFSNIVGGTGIVGGVQASSAVVDINRYLQSIP